MKKLLLGTAVWLLAGPAQAETINILMEGVPDTRYVQELLPEFEQADRHRRRDRGRQLRRDAHQARAAAGAPSRAATTAIVVDFYWVGEFTKAGWLQPLDERIKADKVDTSVYVPAMMNLVGKVDGVTYMLPFYNYAMGLTLPQGPARRPEGTSRRSRPSTAWSCACPRPGTNT